MKTCPNLDCPDIALFGVRGEYEQDVSHCAKCGVELEEKPPPPEPEPTPEHEIVDPRWIEPEMPEAGDFVYVASFRDLPSAHLAKALLVAFGLYAELLDEHMVGMNWFCSQAIWGIKLVVITTTPDRAIELLDTDNGRSLDDLPEMALSPSPFEICPQCGSSDVVRPKWSLALKAASFFWLWLILFYPTVKHFEHTRCSACKRRWHPQWIA